MTDAAAASAPSASQQPQATPSVQPYDASQNQNSSNPIPTAIASPITASNPTASASAAASAAAAAATASSIMSQPTAAAAAAVAANNPAAAGGYVRRAAPEPNKRALYVGGLDQRVTDDVLRQIFETTGHVLSVKIIPDKNVSFCATPFRRVCSIYLF